MLTASVGGLCAQQPKPSTVASSGSLVPAFTHQSADLAIVHASVLDIRTGETLPDRTVVIDKGLITGIQRSTRGVARANARTIDARGRLLSPAFVDVHFHTMAILGDSMTPTGGAITALTMSADSINAYRRLFAQLYMPYGVTVVRDVGSAERDLPMLLAWTKQSPDAPDFYPVGAQLVSAESGRVSPPFQVTLADSQTAAAKVREYHDLGIRNVKLYWRLREPEFKGALSEAQKLGMNVTGHVDQQVMTIGRALDLGLRNVEHIHTLALSVMRESELDSLYALFSTLLGVSSNRDPGIFFLATTEYWNHVGPDDPRIVDLIAKFRADDASLTPTLHVIAQRFGLTYSARRF